MYDTWRCHSKTSSVSSMPFRTCFYVSFSSLKAGRVCTVSIECLTPNDLEALQLLKGKAGQLCTGCTKKKLCLLTACCYVVL